MSGINAAERRGDGATKELNDRLTGVRSMIRDHVSRRNRKANALSHHGRADLPA
jgi:hypothetical protein